MTILIVNPNTNSAMTDALVRRASAVCSADFRVEGITAPLGPPLVSRRRDAAVAATGVLAALATRTSEVDAAVVGAFADPGLEAAREVMPFPVVGLLEASLFSAAQLGARIGLVYGSARMIPVLEERLRAIGFRDRVCGIRTPSDGVRPSDPADVIKVFGALAMDLQATDKAEVIILGGGSLIGLAPQFEQFVPVPVVDSIDCAVLQACMLARLGAKKAQVGSYSRPPSVNTVGLPTGLQRLFAQG